MVKSTQIPADVFQTKLGWMGLTWQDTTLSGVTFGRPTRASVLTRLAAMHGQKVTVSSRITASQRALRNQLIGFAKGDFQSFQNVEIDLTWATEFQKSVLGECRAIGWGETATYGDLAERAGSPRAARAVGSVMSNNRFPIIIPCHRVVSSTGNGGFTAPGGVSMKTRMLRLEQQVVAS